MSELNLLNQPEILFEKKLIFYGTGSAAESFYSLMKLLSINPIAFCDSNINKRGTYFLGYPVIVPDELLDFINIKDYCIIICSNFIKEIYSVLIEHEIPLDIIYTKYTAILALNYCAVHSTFPRLNYIKNRNYLLKEIIKAETESPFNCDAVLETERLVQMLSVSKPLILNFTPEKTGSTTIFNALDKNKFLTYHVHDFDKLFSKLQSKKDIDIWKKCRDILQDRKIKIITGVREPISREISAFFQLLNVSGGLLLDYNISFENMVNSFLLATIGKCRYSGNVFLKQGYNQYLLHNIRYGCEFDWFDLELKKYWNIDVYKEKFDKSKGYQIYQHKNVEVFVYQLEKLNNLEKILGQFIGQDNFKLSQTNTGRQKNYFKLYNDTIDTIKIPKKFFDFYYTNDNLYFHYFYSSNDINDFRRKWEKKLE